MTPNTISNILFIGLALLATVAQHWLPSIPVQLIDFLWGLAGYNGVKTAAIAQHIHDTTSTTQEPTTIPPNPPTTSSRAGGM